MTAPKRLGEPLTVAEHQSLVLLADGLSDEATAQRVGVTASAVRSQRQRARQKLGAGSDSHMVAIGFRTGLIPGAAAPLPPAVPIPHERALSADDVPRGMRAPLSAPPSVLEELVACAEAVLAGLPPRVTHRLAMRALTAAGLRGPGGRHPALRKRVVA